MNLQHVNAKIFVDGEPAVDLRRIIEVFHGWVAEQSMGDMLIDVADYRHVPAGPGVVLVGLRADYALDNRDNRPGLLYNRKAGLDGGNDDRLMQALRSAAKVCLLLEEQFENLAFSRQQFELFINDRALAPNNDETYESFRAILTPFLRDRLGQSQFDVEYNRDPRGRLGAVVRLSTPVDFGAM